MGKLNLNPLLKWKASLKILFSKRKFLNSCLKNNTCSAFRSRIWQNSSYNPWETKVSKTVSISFHKYTLFWRTETGGWGKHQTAIEQQVFSESPKYYLVPTKNGNTLSRCVLNKERWGCVKHWFICIKLSSHLNQKNLVATTWLQYP